MASPSEPYIDLEWRSQHVAVTVKDCLYIWGGNQPRLPPAHKSALKLRLTSFVCTLRLSSGRWSSQHTTGSPPLGVRGYACVTNGTSILYFGGRCGHHQCYHNSVNSLDTLTMNWSELHPTADNYVTKRGYGGMVMMETNGAKHLLAIGGLGSESVAGHRHFQYTKTPSGNVRTNEQNLFNISTRQWIIPTVSGHCCPPTSGFSIQNINSKKAVMFGGRVTEDGVSVPNNNMYLCEVNNSTIHWENVKQPGPGNGLWPAERYRHASTTVIGDSLSPTIVMIGGADRQFKPLRDGCWLFQTTNHNWGKIDLPDSVSNRYDHALSSFYVGPNHVWLVIVGGCLEGEQRNVGKPKRTSPVYVHEPALTMLIELVFIEGNWSVMDVLDFNALSSEHFQWKYQALINTRQWWEDWFYKNPSNTDVLLHKRIQSLENELQELQKSQLTLKHEADTKLQSLKSELQVSQQNKVSLQEALLEAEKECDKLQIDILQISERKSLQEVEGCFVDDNDSKTFTLALTEEKPNVQFSAERDMTIAKLKKENLQLKEKLNNISLNDVGVQCDYWTKNELPFDDMITLGRKLCMFDTKSSHELHLEELGLLLSLPDGLYSPEDCTVYEAAVQGLWGGNFEFPADTHLISSVCYISLSPTVSQLKKPVTVQLVHSAHLTSSSQSQYLSFVVAQVNLDKQAGPFKFEFLPGGSFLPNSQIGSIEVKSFSLLAIVMGVCAAGVIAAGVIAATSYTAKKNATPDFYCRALMYKKVSCNRVMLNLTVIQDLPSCKELLERDSTVQFLLGTEETSFRFPSKVEADDHLMKVNNFPSEPIDGWIVKPFNPPAAIKTNDVFDYCDSKSAEPPYIQILVQPDNPACADTLSHTLHCNMCNYSRDWSIEVSKTEISSHENILLDSSGLKNTPINQDILALPCGIFREKIHLLSSLIGNEAIFPRVVDHLLSEDLISIAFIDDINSSNKSGYNKASEIVRQLFKNLQSSDLPQQMLEKICHVFTQQEDKRLKELGHSMLSSVSAQK
ncbi:PREDICTED: uncharacterized protein LOC109582437 [Amphimedon queenslandica]|uniref:CARD domain-containing protein n=1 Tax=Amphimedon queenslandica TaxID=400682 RepID=A0A1X7URQ9_AMPQE|nr:PREDICTED: uncharacterized protein LOC109582437 [Amphimedon queenslandica]|eukprot:XP_019852709.1 PREDICTED: uncharacterized protein LOC109582437 [Amphimedon queenslandica]